jgi:hypothetical protein
MGWPDHHITNSQFFEKHGAQESGFRIQAITNQDPGKIQNLKSEI